MSGAKKSARVGVQEIGGKSNEGDVIIKGNLNLHSEWENQMNVNSVENKFRESIRNDFLD